MPPTNVPAVPARAVFGPIGRTNLSTLIAVGVLFAWLLVMVAVPLAAPYDPLMPAGPRLAAPGPQHWFGTDALGRDVLSRTMFGVRYSLPSAVIVVIVSAALGAIVGLAAGYLDGVLGFLLMRLADVVEAFPPLILALAIAAVMGPGLLNTCIAIVIVWWPVYARLVRAEVLAHKRAEHVAAAKLSGAGPLRIMVRYLLPVSSTPLIVAAIGDTGGVIIMIAGLSFIGLGTVPPTPEWGLMIFEGAERYQYWWIATFPGLALLSVVLALNFLGDALAQALDPRQAS